MILAVSQRPQVPGIGYHVTQTQVPSQRLQVIGTSYRVTQTQVPLY